MTPALVAGVVRFGACRFPRAALSATSVRGLDCRLKGKVIGNRQFF